MQASLNTPVIDIQVPHQAATPRTVTATTAEQQGTVWTQVAQMIPHTPILDLSRKSAPKTTSVTSLASRHQGPSQMPAVPESQTTAILPSEPLDLSFRTAPHHQMENRKPACQLPRTPRTTSACLYGSDPDQQHVAASTLQRRPRSVCSLSHLMLRTWLKAKTRS